MTRCFCDDGNGDAVLTAFQGHVEQHIEPGKVRIAVDDGLRLLALQSGELLNGFQEFIQEPILLSTKPDLGNVCAGL